MQALITLRLIADQIINHLRRRAYTRQGLILGRRIIVHPTHRRIRRLHTPCTSRAARWTALEEKVDCSRFQEVAMQFIDIRQGANFMRAHKLLIRERLQLPKDLDIPCNRDLILAPGETPLIRVHIIDGSGVHPLLDLDFLGAVIDLVGDVGGLGGDIADLTDEDNVRRVCAVDLVVCFGVGLGRVDGLFDSDGADGLVIYIALLMD